MSGSIAFIFGTLAAQRQLHSGLVGVRRSSELSDVDHAAVRRLVTGAFQRVIATGGQSLGEVSFAAMHLSDAGPALHFEIVQS